MSESIFHLYLVHGFREAYYQLPDGEKQAFWTRVDEVHQAVGSSQWLTCESRWCNERYAAWGIEEFPDLAAVQKSAQLHEQNEHFRYLEAETILGMKIDGSGFEAVPFPNPLYQLWLIKNQNNLPWAGLAKAERDRIMAHVNESIQKRGGVSLLICNSNWASEEYPFFGVTAWPSLEAEQAHFQDTTELGWHNYIHAQTILGTRLG